MSNINISVTEQDPINVSIAAPEVQNVDVTGQSISASVSDGDKGDIVVTGNGSIWTLDPNALSTRVPYTGATADVNLGEFGLLTGNIEFDTSPTNAPTGAGSMVWNDTEGTADLMLKGASVNLPIGQKQVVRAVNGTGGNLTRAQYRAVKITGAQGQRLQVNLARADSDANSKDTIGLVGEDISNNQTGFIVTSGTIENINTTGNLQGETWADGDTLYLSGTTSGVITNVKPSAPTHTVILGFVIYAHANNGKIYTKVDNGYEIGELHDVNVSTAASGDYLRYNGTVWVDSTIQAADLPTGIDAAKIGTGVVSNTEFGYLDGVTSAIQTQLNAKQATLTNPVTGTGTSGQVTYFTGTSAVTGSNNLFWDATNNRFGIGTTSPAQKLDVVGTIQSVNAFFNNPNATAIAIQRGDGTANFHLIGTDSTSGFFINTAGGTSNIQFRLNGTERMRINTGGNVSIGNTNNTYNLDISGTLRNTTDAYFATSSGNVGVGTTSPAEKLHVSGGNTRYDNTYGINWASGSGYVTNTDAITVISGYNGIDLFCAVSTSDIRLRNNQFSGTTMHLFKGNGNVILGGTTDAGYRLDVQGILRNTTSAYFATSSGSVGIGTTTLTSGVILNVAGISEFRGNAYFGKSSATNSIAYFFNSLNDNRGEISFDGTNNIFRIESSYGGGGSFKPMGFFTGTNERLRISEPGGNIGIGQTTFGTSATKTLAVSSGTAPSSSPADAFQMYSADITAGNAAAHFRTEGGAVIKLYQQTTGVAAATFAANTGTAVNDASTFDGYTLNQIVKALRNNGLLA
jgi:hypothetical protein